MLQQEFLFSGGKGCVDMCLFFLTITCFHISEISIYIDFTQVEGDVQGLRQRRIRPGDAFFPGKRAENDTELCCIIRETDMLQS